MANLITIRLSRHDPQPWGFRLHGGRDYKTPLSVLKVNGGSLAEKAGLIAGDNLVRINNVDVFNLTHKDAQDLIVRSGNTFDLTIERNPTTTWRPSVTPTGPLPNPSSYSGPVTKTSLAHKQQNVSHIGCGYNNSARPFNAINGSDGQVKSIVNKQYNSPVAMYSEEAIAETLSAQAEVLAGGVLGVNFKKNEKVYNAANSEVLKFLQEQENEPQEPVQRPHTVVHNPQSHYQQNPVIRHVNTPTDRPKSSGTGGSPAGQTICAECERFIVGPFVRIKDRNLHVDCFKCATCGTSLKNQGYYNLNNKLYCDIHAKYAAMNNPPPGTEGYVPVPIKPGTKLSASTISAALNAHHHHENGGTSHLITSPASNANNYVAPKPFGASTRSPPVSAPKSPTSYPPSSWSQPPKPATNPYATLPRITGQTQECLEQATEYHVRENHCEMQKLRQEHHYEDLEVERATRGHVSSFVWPPPVDEDRYTPTASPLYIAPPETQKVTVKTIQKKEQQHQAVAEHTEQQSYSQTQYAQLQQHHHQQQKYIQHSQVEQQQQDLQAEQQQHIQQQWQSRSAPELTTGRHMELESGSDSYVSTCTTTTTTSEEYQKMYQAQVQAYQMQQMYDQYGSETDYHMDMEMTAIQQHEQNYSNPSFLSMQSGRRSVQECAETILGPVNTYKLVDLVREVTASPEIIPHKGPRKVEFADEQPSKEADSNNTQQQKQSELHKEKQIDSHKEQNSTETHTETEIKSEEKEEQKMSFVKSTYIENEQRKFQPTPEIKIEIPESRPVPPSNIPNPVPKEWISPMVKALTTAPEKPIEISSEIRYCESSCDAKANEAVCKEKKVESEKGQQGVLRESPAKGSFMAKLLTTAPSDKIKFAPKSNEPVQLPEETEPYMPPPIDKKPYLREDYRPKSPLLKALTTAPEVPFSSFGHDVMSQLDDLPTPKGTLTMKDALTVAPERCYTPLNPDNILSLNLDKKEQRQHQLFSEYESLQENKQSIEVQTNQHISALANTKDEKYKTDTQSTILSFPQNSVVSLKDINQESQSSLTHSDSLTKTNAQRNTITQHVNQQQQLQQETCQTSSIQSSSYKCINSSQMQTQTHQIQTSCSTSTAAQQLSCSSNSECHQKFQEAEQKVIYPPPIPAPIAKKPLVSGLHKPDSIPQYQRNWTVLPSQRPVRTPEPQELKENVPLAFVDIPTTEKSPTTQTQAQSTQSSKADSESTQKLNENKQSSSVPVIAEKRYGPVTMTFQSIDGQKENDSQAYPRPFTPSLINKPAPIIPFYQTPEKLVFEECEPTTGQPFDRRSASPFPDRAKSPAPGPPPNPLSAIRAPRIKNEEQLEYRNLQAGSITTGQSCYANQQQGQVLSHYQAASAYGSQSFIDKPEVVQQKRIGDTTIQTREKESRLNEEQHKQLQSMTTTQVGNTQIQRRRKVVEEYEHTQTAKTIEIQKTKGDSIQQQQHQQVRQQYGKTGFVGSQARRLSNLEQEISSISSQSQAISSRAASLGAESPSRFPIFQSPEPVSKFPIKPDISPYDEPQTQSYIVSPEANKKLVGPPPGFQKQQQQQQKLQEQKQQATLSSQHSSYATTSVAHSSLATQSLSASNSNQSSSNASNLSTAIPVPAFKPPVTKTSDALYGKPNLQQLSNNNNTYKPTASTGPAGFKPPQQPAPQASSSNTNPSVVVSDPSPASAGPNKSGAFGATSVPKRGRGILNKAVGPGVRIPLCGCCNTQIRGPFITALGRIWCPDHFVCVNANCRRALQDIGFVEEKGDLYCEYCFERYLAPTCSKCNNKIKGDCLNAIGKHFHPECFTCVYCGKIFGNTPFFLEEGEPYCEADWNELFTTKCFACGFPVEAGDRWVEALNHNYHSQCFNCTMCKKNLEGQSFYNKGGRPFCKNHAR